MIMPSERSLRLAHASLFASTVLWGASFIAMKIAVTAYGPMPVIWGRMAIASLIFMACSRSLRRVVFQLRDIWAILLMALFEPCLYYLFEGYAMHYTTASQAGTVSAILPLTVAVGAHFMLAENIRASVVVGFLVSLAGVAVLSLGGSATEDAPNPVLGNFLEFMAMVSATGYMLLVKRLSARHSPWYLTAMQAVCGAVFFLPAFLWHAPEIPANFAWAPTLAVVFLGTIITVGAYGLYNYGMSILPASQAAAYVNLIPVVAVALGWLMLGERFTTVQFLGAGLVFIGIYCSQGRGFTRRKVASQVKG
ncbi:DMT family transporter [Desulfocurvibacter africanus]|nr:DMT family transporter [Desulfocurvibacter africanus]